MKDPKLRAGIICRLPRLVMDFVSGVMVNGSRAGTVDGAGLLHLLPMKNGCGGVVRKDADNHLQ